MARQGQRDHDRLNRLMVKVQRRYDDSPLSQIGEKFQELIQSGLFNVEQASSVADYIDRALEVLPQSFGERFYFDAAQIQALANTLSQGPVKLSQMIVPRHDKDWGHLTLPMPSEPSGKHHVVDLILIPGEDYLDDVDLRSYPFLCHELVHNLLFRDDSTFIQEFEGGLNRILNSLRLSGIADRGSARTHAKSLVDELQRIWYPSKTQKNWTHEIAIDVITFWVCGPAYLAILEDAMSNPDTNPYKIDRDYPPYAVRALSLGLASDLFEWSEYVEGFKAMTEAWKHTKWKAEQTNQYLTLANSELVKETVSSAFGTCKFLQLPKCTPDLVDRIRSDVHRGDLPDFGIALLVAAWIAKRDYDERTYKAWEQKVIRALVNSITR